MVENPASYITTRDQLLVAVTQAFHTLGTYEWHSEQLTQGQIQECKDALAILEFVTECIPATDPKWLEKILKVQEAIQGCRSRTIGYDPKAW